MCASEFERLPDEVNHSRFLAFDRLHDDFEVLSSEAVNEQLIVLELCNVIWDEKGFGELDDNQACPIN